eukprot:8599256-Alexandrium_andersonii.AAC.1
MDQRAPNRARTRNNAATAAGASALAHPVGRVDVVKADRVRGDQLQPGATPDLGLALAQGETLATPVRTGTARDLGRPAPPWV